jgi:hypothetical protein
MKFLFIPSCEVAAQNTLDGTTTEKRLVAGINLWNKGGFDKIIVTGGIYLPPNLQTIPSGELMRDWLINQGVPAEKIVCENKSRDTYENISEALKLVADDHNPAFTVITHWQHALRFWITFRPTDKYKVKIIPLWYWYGIKTFVLEWFILLVHLFDKKGTGWIATKNRQARTFPKK